MQTIILPSTPNPLYPLYLALGIAANHGCINAESLYNGSELFEPWTKTQQNWLAQLETTTIHGIYALRDDQEFSLEPDTFNQALYELLLEEHEILPTQPSNEDLYNAASHSTSGLFECFTFIHNEKLHYMIILLDI